MQGLHIIDKAIQVIRAGNTDIAIEILENYKASAETPITAVLEVPKSCQPCIAMGICGYWGGDVVTRGDTACAGFYKRLNTQRTATA